MTEIIINLQHIYNVNPNRLTRFNLTGLKLLQFIFQNLQTIVKSELTLECFKTIATAGTGRDIWDWVNNNFLPPLSDKIISIVDTEYHFAFKSLKRGLSRYRSWIYRGIVFYIYDTERVNGI